MFRSLVSDSEIAMRMFENINRRKKNIRSFPYQLNWNIIPMRTKGRRQKMKIKRKKTGGKKYKPTTHNYSYPSIIQISAISIRNGIIRAICD